MMAINDRNDAVTTDRDLLPKELVKKLGLLKINLLPKTDPDRGILNHLSLPTPDLQFRESTGLTTVECIGKQFILQEKNLIYAPLADNIWVCNRRAAVTA
jgi:hypothetical protein